MIYHISHNDLDGYVSQYIVKNYYNNNKIYFKNIGYNEILNELEKLKKKNITQKDLIIITDLSFNQKQFEYLEKNFKNKNIIFIDHHKSSLNSISFLIQKDIKKEKFLNIDIDNWKIVINTNYSAAKLTYKFFYPNKNNLLEYIIELTNIYDTWQKTNDDFYKSIFYSNLIFMDFPLFENDKRLLNFYLIEKIVELLKNNTVRNVEKDLNNIIYQFLKIKFKKELKEFKDVDNIDIKTFTALLQYNNIKKNSVKIKNIYVIKNCSNDILQYGIIKLFEKEEDIIVLNIIENSNFNKLSIRSNNEKAIKIAEYFNGGGHPNSSGAITNLSYEDILYELMNIDL